MAEALFIETIRRYMERFAAGADRLACGCAGSASSAERWRFCTGNLGIAGAWTNLPSRPASHALSSPRGSPAFSASRRWPIWRDGDCSLLRGCCRRRRDAVLQVASEVGYEFRSSVQSRVQARVWYPTRTIPTVGLPIGTKQWRQAKSHRIRRCVNLHWRARCISLKASGPEESPLPHPAITKDNVAVITGGASGIGLAAAMRFAALGMKVCIADLGADRLEEAETRCRRPRPRGGASIMAAASTSAASRM